MLRIHSNNLVRRQAKRHLTAVGLVAILAFAGAARAAALEVAALTPELVAAFNAQTIREFTERNPDAAALRFGLSAEARQRLARLAVTAAEFRSALAADAPELDTTVAQENLELFQATMELGPDGPPPVLWQSFFRGSIVAVGRALAPVSRVGFYNPLVDGWVMTDWSISDGAPRLVAVYTLAGGVTRDDEDKSFELPDWTRKSEDSAVGALALTHREAMDGFARGHPLIAEQSADSAIGFDWRADRRIIESRLGAMRRSLNILARPAFQTAASAFLQGLYSGDTDKLASLLEDGSAASVYWVNGLLTPIRVQFRPTGVLHSPDGISVIFGVPENGRWLLFARYGAQAGDEPPVLRSLAFVDLVTSANGGAEQ